MSIVDANGAIHAGHDGRFTGHVQVEGDTARTLPTAPITHTTCPKCGREVFRDADTWVDETGGDVCRNDRGDDSVHLMSLSVERPVSSLHAGDTIRTQTGTLRVTTFDPAGGRISGVDQWGEWDATDLPGPDATVLVLAAPATVDEVITGTDADLFTEASIEQLRESWHHAIASGATHVRASIEQQIGLTRAKRIADATTAIWPDARFVIIKADADGGRDLHVAGIRFSNRDTIDADPADPRWLMLDAETLGLYGDDLGWQNTCAQSGPTWLLTVAEARQIDGVDLSKGLYETSRHRAPGPGALG